MRVWAAVTCMFGWRCVHDFVVPCLETSGIMFVALRRGQRRGTFCATLETDGFGF